MRSIQCILVVGISVDSSHAAHFNVEGIIYCNRVISVGNFAAFKTSLCAVVFQQVRKYFWAGEVIYSYYINTFHVVNLAENQTADTSETVDGDFYCAHINWCLILKSTAK